jgi:hypothetical protein
MEKERERKEREQRQTENTHTHTGKRGQRKRKTHLEGTGQVFAFNLIEHVNGKQRVIDQVHGIQNRLNEKGLDIRKLPVDEETNACTDGDGLEHLVHLGFVVLTHSHLLFVGRSNILFSCGLGFSFSLLLLGFLPWRRLNLDDEGTTFVLVINHLQDEEIEGPQNNVGEN